MQSRPVNQPDNQPDVATALCGQSVSTVAPMRMLLASQFPLLGCLYIGMGAHELPHRTLTANEFEGLRFAHFATRPMLPSASKPSGPDVHGTTTWIAVAPGGLCVAMTLPWRQGAEGAFELNAHRSISSNAVLMDALGARLSAPAHDAALARAARELNWQLKVGEHLPRRPEPVFAAREPRRALAAGLACDKHCIDPRTPSRTGSHRRFARSGHVSVTGDRRHPVSDAAELTSGSGDLHPPMKSNIFVLDCLMPV